MAEVEVKKERKGGGADEVADDRGEHERSRDTSDDHREEPREEAAEEGTEGEREVEDGEDEEGEDDEGELGSASGRLPRLELTEKLLEEEILQQVGHT